MTKIIPDMTEMAEEEDHQSMNDYEYKVQVCEMDISSEIKAAEDRIKSSMLTEERVRSIVHEEIIKIMQTPYLFERAEGL